MTSNSARIPRFVLHPVGALLIALTLLAGAGALMDSFVGPRGSAASPCSVAAADWRSSLRAEIQVSGADAALLEEWRGRVAYESLWAQAAPLLGSSGTLPPRIRFLTGREPKPDTRAAMWVGPDEQGCRTIFITPGQRRALAKREGNWRSRAAALKRTMHETAHYFQSDQTLFDITGRELGASRWAQRHTPQLLGTRKGSRSLVAAPWVDHDQFGDNYGGDPETFGWPGTGLRSRPATQPPSPSP